MNKKGQALVEFIIILPIIIFILLAIIDYGTISHTKSKLENIITDVSSMIKNNENEEEINKFVEENDNNLNLEILKEEKYITIKLYKKYDYITPGLNKIFKTDNINIERKIYYEQ